MYKIRNIVSNVTHSFGVIQCILSTKEIATNWNIKIYADESNTTANDSHLRIWFVAMIFVQLAHQSNYTTMYMGECAMCVENYAIHGEFN